MLCSYIAVYIFIDTKADRIIKYASTHTRMTVQLPNIIFIGNVRKYFHHGINLSLYFSSGDCRSIVLLGRRKSNGTVCSIYYTSLRRWVKQYSNDPKHLNKSTPEWLWRHKTRLLEWPSHITDLNLTEMLGTDLKRAAQS